MLFIVVVWIFDKLFSVLLNCKIYENFVSFKIFLKSFMYKDFEKEWINIVVLGRDMVYGFVVFLVIWNVCLIMLYYIKVGNGLLFYVFFLFIGLLLFIK